MRITALQFSLFRKGGTEISIVMLEFVMNERSPDKSGFRFSKRKLNIWGWGSNIEAVMVRQAHHERLITRLTTNG
jgi:hypothetical protein